MVNGDNSSLVQIRIVEDTSGRTRAVAVHDPGGRNTRFVSGPLSEDELDTLRRMFPPRTDCLVDTRED